MTGRVNADVQTSEDGTVRRVQLDLPRKAFDRLNLLKVETEASTYAEVIKNALKLYASAIEIQKNGGRFLIENEDGTTVPLIVFS